MRIVSLIGPAPCGAYQVHLDLMHKLAQHGCSLTWLASGAMSAHAFQLGGFEPSAGDLVAAHSDNMTVRTRALVDRLHEISPDMLLCHAIGDKTDFNAIRYFADSIPKILILHNTMVAVYRAARAVRHYVNATVAISQRVEQDLVSSYGFRGHRMKLIPNGIELSAYPPRTMKEPSARVRILVHGRIGHAQKGVLWVPEILARLLHIPNWDCTISGDGPDLPRLRQRVIRKGLGNRVTFTGWTPHQDVPALMSRHDVLLFPSKYEGYPLALIEAMAAGCVPVASRLSGITDAIIQVDVNGLLFPVGNVTAAADLLDHLVSNPGRLGSLSQRAQASAFGNSLDSMCDQYYKFICDVVRSPGRTQPPESLDHCVLARDLRPAWWNHLPNPIKDRLRVVRENVRTVLPIP
jgi:glycosyltransferase involved in cell wall biosynthesis